MRIPQKPPPYMELLQKQAGRERLGAVLSQVGRQPASEHYLHWEKLRHYPPPEGLTLEEWWLAIKLQRNGVTGHFKTSQSGSNQNQPFRGALFISVLLSHARGFTVSSNLLHFSWR